MGENPKPKHPSGNLHGMGSKRLLELMGQKKDGATICTGESAKLKSSTNSNGMNFKTSKRSRDEVQDLPLDLLRRKSSEQQAETHRPVAMHKAPQRLEERSKKKKSKSREQSSGSSLPRREAKGTYLDKVRQELHAAQVRINKH